RGPHRRTPGPRPPYRLLEDGRLPPAGDPDVPAARFRARDGRSERSGVVGRAGAFAAGSGVTQPTRLSSGPSPDVGILHRVPANLQPLQVSDDLLPALVSSQLLVCELAPLALKLPAQGQLHPVLAGRQWVDRFEEAQELVHDQ